MQLNRILNIHNHVGDHGNFQLRTFSFSHSFVTTFNRKALELFHTFFLNEQHSPLGLDPGGTVGFKLTGMCGSNFKVQIRTLTGI